MRDALCKAFCGQITVRRVPVGLAVSTGFRREDGDAVGFYVVDDAFDTTYARLEDDGDTVAVLEASGVDLTEGARAEAFATLLTEYGIEFHAEEGVLRTGPLQRDKVPDAAMRFVAFLLRMQDFMLITRERVEETFKDDVVRAVTERFDGRAEVLLDEAIAPALRHYEADIVLKAKGHYPLALFVGTSDAKALEALLLHFRIHAANGSAMGGKVMLVLDTAKPARIKERTLARAINNFPVSVFKGEEEGALAAIERQLFDIQGTLQ